ncbi:putative Kinase [Melia azedarach]|uniref:Kinase n=1 Tax=Melia azedarach TaxID=155640 RepID=A0ACC1YJR9_MELAZ|nr:putative Kinase [Melia azedarach]
MWRKRRNQNIQELSHTEYIRKKRESRETRMNTLLGLHIILLLWLLNASAAMRICPDTNCGDVSIGYPFGTEKGCYFNEWFEVTCNSQNPFLRKINLALYDISTLSVMVNLPVISSGCGRNSTGVSVNLSGSPFYFSDSENRFTAIGCSNYATMVDQNNSVIGGCLSVCNGDEKAGKEGCYGINCCQTTIPPNLKYFKSNLSNFPNFVNTDNQKYCKSAFMVDKNWFDSIYPLNSNALIDEQYLPATLGWGKYIGSCFERSDTICNSLNQGACWIRLSSSQYLCLCDTIDQGYCQGSMYCMNNHCSGCPPGYYNSSQGGCSPLFVNEIVHSRLNVRLIIGCISGGLGMLLLLIGGWWLYKFVKKRREIKLQQKFFKRNGGLLLQQELSSNKGNVDKTKLFSSKELEKATDNYNTDRILGQGGQGTVYKGMLADGKIVAVKKSKIVDESKVEEFINEMVILSQINHRNVVKLLGCCLETQVPLLVYEFIANGTLFQYIHDQTKEFPITWEMRLRITVEISSALSYLHSAASIPIYHRDIKTANILLDDKYRAKVSDFGTSRSMTIDQTHLTTQVQGTFGYLDPEYFRSSQFTEKSDVYSFGVVLAELLTGQKPIRSTTCEEDRSLAAYFLCAMKENRLFEVLDSRVLKEGSKEEIIIVARLAQRCLNLNGKKRPTMREVANELINIKGDSIVPPNFEEIIDCQDGDMIGYNLETGSSSIGIGSFFSNSTTFSIDADPLISNNC